MPLVCPRCVGVDLDEIEVGDVVLDRCSRCGGLWFDHGEIGETAGGGAALSKLEAAVPAAPEQEEALACPRCADVWLRELRFGLGQGRQGFVFRCPSCCGTWLDRGELRAQEDRQLPAALRRYFTDASTSD